MPLYTGTIYEDYLVDRAALGLPLNLIVEDFTTNVGVNITENDVVEILVGKEERIKQREKELAEEFKSTTVLSRLEKIYKKLNEEIELSDLDPKTLAILTREARGFLDSIAKVTGQVKEGDVTIDNLTIVKQNLEAFDELSELGVISIKDKEKLKKLLGVSKADYR